ncbi:two-component system, OmpR family, sensor histidine kinase VicK [Planctomycetaceae bacterium]|nr:two-component system, OmpR family, sensor histidine kinase VicK [Planctomycetaceae bacterium]
MRKIRIAMLLYVAVGLIPLAALSTYAWPRVEKDYKEELGQAQYRDITNYQNNWRRAQESLQDLVLVEFSREFTEFQHWRAPLNIQSQAPSVVRSPLAGQPTNPLIKYYFQFRSDGGAVKYSTPHEPDGVQQLESYQSAAPLPSGFQSCLNEARESLTTALPALLSAPLENEKEKPPTGDLLTMFLQAKSGDKPASIQLVANDVLIVNSNSQEVANQARSAQVQKRQNKKENSNDPWSDLKKPPGIDDQYGDSLVQVFPYRMYVRSGSSPKMIFWRTVRTPAEQILQGFEVNLEYVRAGWLGGMYGDSFLLGQVFDSANPRPPLNVAIESKYDARLEGGRATRLGIELGIPNIRKFDTRGFDERFERTRNNYLLLGLCYVGLLGLLGFALHRTVSRSEALAQQQGEFVAAVSHELRTPLTAMRLFTELLIGQARTAKNEKVEQHASRILAEEERLTRLVEMILLAAKIERGSFRVELTNAPLADPLNAAIEAAQRAHVGREIILEARDLPSVVQDRAAAQQVFFNLIDNALKYSRESGKPVRITAETKDRKHFVRIIDQGAGIDEYDKKRLFERFARGTKANEQGAGTGLGLWLTREYAKQMGWEVTLESKPGEGTTAIVEIPF